MTQRIGPHQIETATATADGQVLTFVASVREYQPRALPVIRAGPNVTVDNTDPLNPIVGAIVLEPLTTETGGVPDLVWDTDNQLVMTRVI